MVRSSNCFMRVLHRRRNETGIWNVPGLILDFSTDLRYTVLAGNDQLEYGATERGNVEL